MKSKGINAAAWFAAQSFNGGARGETMSQTLPVDELKTASGLKVRPVLIPGANVFQFVIESAGGKDLTCGCCRVLYWKEHADGYSAYCCMVPRFERKAGV
jgi:hypothetical protein